MKEFSILLCLLLSATLTQAQTGETKKPARYRFVVHSLKSCVFRNALSTENVSAADERG